MDTSAVAPPEPLSHSVGPARKPLRLWYPAALVIAYWVSFLVLRRTELTTVVRFMSGFGSSVLLTILFVAWWLISRRVPPREKWAGLAALVGGSVAAVFLARAV